MHLNQACRSLRWSTFPGGATVLQHVYHSMGPVSSHAWLYALIGVVKCSCQTCCRADMSVVSIVQNSLGPRARLLAHTELGGVYQHRLRANKPVIGILQAAEWLVHCWAFADVLRNTCIAEPYMHCRPTSR